MDALLVDGRAHASMPDAHTITNDLLELEHFAENGLGLARRLLTGSCKRLKRFFRRHAIVPERRIGLVQRGQRQLSRWHVQELTDLFHFLVCLPDPTEAGVVVQ